jgi:lipopolysaccharide transport system permease protein
MKPEPVLYEINAAQSRLLNFRELWRYRELFYFFTWRDIKVKYKQTVLGFIWAILQPLLMMLIFTLFFARALNIQNLTIPYPIFVFSGLIIWNFFSSALTNASNSMVYNAPIIKKIYFPRLIIPVSSILGALFDFVMAFVLFLIILLYYKTTPSIHALYYWPLGLLTTAIASLGLGSWLSALNVKYRDFRYVIPFLVQVLFFVTPVIYPTSLIEQGWIQYLIALSPMYAAIELFRIPLLETVPNYTFLFMSIASGIFFLFVGLIYFRRTEDFFADLA